MGERRGVKLKRDSKRREKGEKRGSRNKIEGTRRERRKKREGMRIRSPFHPHTIRKWVVCLHCFGDNAFEGHAGNGLPFGA